MQGKEEVEIIATTSGSLLLKLSPTPPPLHTHLLEFKGTKMDIHLSCILFHLLRTRNKQAGGGDIRTALKNELTHFCSSCIPKFLPLLVALISILKVQRRSHLSHKNRRT